VNRSSRPLQFLPRSRTWGFLPCSVIACLFPSGKHGSAVDDAVVPPVRAHWQSPPPRPGRAAYVERYGRAAGFQPNEWMAMNDHGAVPIQSALPRARMRNHSLQRWGWASVCTSARLPRSGACEGGMGSVQPARSVTRGGGCEGSDDPAPRSTNSHVAPLGPTSHWESSCTSYVTTDFFFGFWNMVFHVENISFSSVEQFEFILGTFDF
jgi:hypothetical protein